MRFVKPSLGSIPIGTGKSGRSAGTCPSIEVGDQFNEELEGGEYHLVVEADPGSVVFNYLLRIGVTES
jgi:hypothetical protein